MNIKQTITTLIAAFAMVFVAVAMPVAVNAQDGRCGGADTAIITCPDQDNQDPKDITTNGVWGLLLIAINLLTAGVGILAVGGVIYGSILYTTAGDKAEQVKKAIGVIMNVVIGVVAYIAMYAILQFLIPGGIFK